jgi:hypothetical protein
MMNLRKAKAIFSVLVGGAIVSLWIMLFVGGQIPAYPLAERGNKVYPTFDTQFIAAKV